MRQSAPTVLSLFTGMGGLDYGLEAAGFETRVGVDVDPDSCATVRANRSWDVVRRDVHDVTATELLSRAGLSTGDADLLVGGPPCQPFSKAGYWAKGDSLRLEDPRAATLHAFTRIWRDTLPRVVLFENVAGFAYRGKSEALAFLLGEVERINRELGTAYRPVSQVLQAADYGVPQLRERFVLVAARDDTQFEFPEPAFCSAHASQPRMLRSPYRTAWDAIGDLSDEPYSSLELSGKWACLLKSIPEGENYLYHTNRGNGLPLFGWRRRYWTFLLKLAKNLPSWTIQAQPGPSTGPFHWQNRQLSDRELCRLQTIPDDVQVVGSRISVRRQIGNAVPSLMAETVGNAIASQLLGRGEWSGPTLLPPDRSPSPRPEPVAPVEREYLRLIGEHDDHPGPGKGPRASATTHPNATP